MDSSWWGCAPGKDVFLKAWKEGKQCENSQHLAHSAFPIIGVTEGHMHTRWEKKWAGVGSRQADRGAKEETEKEMVPEPYSEETA